MLHVGLGGEADLTRPEFEAHVVLQQANQHIDDPQTEEDPVWARKRILGDGDINQWNINASLRIPVPYFTPTR